MEKLFTSESVTFGHPDKLSDLIADSILDAYLSKDKNARVACEVALGKNKVYVLGEITSKAKVDIEKVVRKTILDVGYDQDALLFNGHTCQIIKDLSCQSKDIAQGVNGRKIKAGDQGIMYGYATDETPNYMPLVHNLAHALTDQLTYVRQNNLIKGLRPDGKTQVTLTIEKEQVYINTIVVSCQHDEDKSFSLLKKEIKEKVIKAVIPSCFLKNTQILINPTGRFVIGGPVGDAGLTGRKTMVDTYGGIAHHGGGAFSGKDYTKVDRSAAYYARYVAKNIVASGLAKKCEVRVAYAIGVAKPVMVDFDCFNTNLVEETLIKKVIDKFFNFEVQNIIDTLNLKNLEYTFVTQKHHFGIDSLPWEKTDLVSPIKKYVHDIISRKI